MKRIKPILLFLLFVSLFSCNKNDDKADGYGNFEATEVTISAEANGKIEYLKLEEGDLLQPNTVVGLVDTIQLHLNKQQLVASKMTVFSKSENVLSQISVLQAQLKTALVEQKRIQNMFAENAATQRQVDEVEGKTDVIHKQIKSVQTQNAPILNEIASIDIQIKKIEDQIKKSVITNPIQGTVLAKYAEPNEITTFGKPLYKIANLHLMNLRVYVSEPQLPQIKLNQNVTIKIDNETGMKSYSGKISWISSVAEFTPKIIQTKEERVNLVYAVKVDVKNDGSLKIGMPAEMWIK
jgi:HlyD family secretion protein